MQQVPSKSDGKKVILIIGVVLLLLFGCGALVCVGSFAGLFGTFTSASKAYYPECETLQGSDACQSCCSRNGHSGYVSGEVLNEPGRPCGCL